VIARLVHDLRWRRRLSLLSLGALREAERTDTQGHVASCARCEADLAAHRALLTVLEADPVRTAQPELPLAAFVARVEARLAVAPARAPLRRALAYGPLPLAAAAALAVALLVPTLLRAPQPHGPVAAERIEVSHAALVRLERTVAREQAARYLNDAQDVLVTVAATSRDCAKGGEQVDVGAEARRSRELLARRALLELDRDDIASARPVLHDVEGLLREVASLAACARRSDVASIQRQLEHRRVLMKIDLMTRELLG
jgi:hypothetical protein